MPEEAEERGKTGREWEVPNITIPICGVSVIIHKILSSDSSQFCNGDSQQTVMRRK